MMADLRQALRQAPALVVGVVQDGAPELWNLLGAAVLAEPLVTTYYEAIDRYHLNERLGEVLRYIEPDVTARGDQLAPASTCEQGVHTRMGFQGVRRLGVAKPYYRIKVIGDTFLQC